MAKKRKETKAAEVHAERFRRVQKATKKDEDPFVEFSNLVSEYKSRMDAIEMLNTEKSLLREQIIEARRKMMQKKKIKTHRENTEDGLHISITLAEKTECSDACLLEIEAACGSDIAELSCVAKPNKARIERLIASRQIPKSLEKELFVVTPYAIVKVSEGRDLDE